MIIRISVRELLRRHYIAGQYIIDHDRNMLLGTAIFGTNTLPPNFSILEVYPYIDITPVSLLNIIPLVSCSLLPIRRLSSSNDKDQ
jgi:hypothetical protein